MLRRPPGDRTINEIKNHKVTARRSGVVGPYGDLTRLLQLQQVCRTAAVRFSRHPRPPRGHRKVTVRWPWGAVAASWHCGFCKKFNVKFKKPQVLRWPCGVLKTVRSPYGLHKNRKAAVRFEGLRSPYGRRKHAASYMWPWHYPIHIETLAVIYLNSCGTKMSKRKTNWRISAAQNHSCNVGQQS